MSLLYRVLRRAYARSAFDGEGAYRYGGRWSSTGTRLAYASEHQSLAMLEYFVHLDAQDPPPDLVLAIADIPHDLSRESTEISKLPRNWRQTPPPAELARFGDDFASRQQSALLIVPSALVPRESNCLINPAHRDFSKIAIHELEPLSYDQRMFRRTHRLQKRK